MPLHIEKELNAMLDRGFSPELVEKLVACPPGPLEGPGPHRQRKAGTPALGRPDPAPDPPSRRTP